MSARGAGLVGLVVSALALCLAAPARAEVERFGLFVGHNQGQKDEANLRFAHADAARLHDVLQEIGGLRAENAVLLRDPDARRFRQALVDLNDRIRRRAGAETMLVVYYSGHADAEGLHLGDTTLETRELEQLVRGSSATFRLLVLDSCRSGAVTRVKGGVTVPPFTIRLEGSLASEGVAFVSSSAGDEDAQESDALGGSFFSHYLVSGLLGAGDEDGDGRVDVEEAFRYASSNTIRASSRTLAGLQHPTFRYDVRGRAPVALTAPSARDPARGILEFPEGASYLVLREGAAGAVVAEVSVHDRVRRLSVRPGRYHLVGRARRHLLEGAVAVAPGARIVVREAELDRVEYARLVRKGEGLVGRVHALDGGYRVRSALVRGASACHGGTVGYRLALPGVTLGARLGACRASFSNAFVAARADELDGELRAAHAWDGRRFTFELGLAAGGAILRQSFETTGRAPPRTSAAAHLGAVAGASFQLGRGVFVGLEALAGTYLFSQRTDEAASRVRPEIAARADLVVGKQF